MQRERELALSGAVLAICIGCNEVMRESYKDYAAAERAGAVTRGWIPDFVPRSAVDIAEVHDLDLNTQRLRFRVPDVDLRRMTAGILPMTADEALGASIGSPELEGDWPSGLPVGRGGRSADLTLFGAHSTEESHCIAVDWKNAIVYAWSCNLNRVSRSRGIDAVQTAGASEKGRVDTSASSDLWGRWVVTAHGFAAVSALTEEEARRRYGMEASFGADHARFGKDTCSRPTYSGQIVDASRYILEQFRTTPAETGIQPDSAGQMRITEIRCRGEDWNAIPSTVFWAGRDRIALFEDGVFLLLRRQLTQ